MLFSIAVGILLLLMLYVYHKYNEEQSKKWAQRVITHYSKNLSQVNEGARILVRAGHWYPVEVARIFYNARKEISHG